MASIGEFDVGPLTWVKGEIDQALARSIAALKAFIANPGDAAQIKHSQTHFHQAHGALQIVGLDGVARFSEEIEGLLADLASGAAQPGTASVAERAVGTISAYLEQLLAGQPNQPLKLYSAYRDVVVARGKPAPDQVDLYFPNVAGRVARRVPVAPGAERSAVLRGARSRFMRGLLRWLRKDREGMREMHGAVASIEEIEAIPAAYTFWWTASTLLDGIAQGALSDEAGVPRLCNRIERQIKRLIDGASSGVAERLMRELLFHAARAKPATAALREAQSTFGLAGSVPEHFELRDEDAELLPRLRGLREAITAAKSHWAKYTAGHGHSAAPMAEQLAEVRSRAATLGRRELSGLSEELVAVADGLNTATGAPSEALAIEVATALLLIEDVVERFATLSPEFGEQCQAMIARLRKARGIRTEEAAPASAQLDEMSRRAQERVAIAQLVTEIQSNLREIEKELDGFFRDQSRRGELGKLDKPINQVLGAFRILNDAKAEQALAECATKVRRFADPGYRAADGEFEHVAGVLSGLGFYIDALQHGKADFDEVMRPIGTKEAVVEEATAPEPVVASVETQLEQHKRDTQALVEAWQASPDDAAKKEELRQHVEALQHDAVLVADSDLERRAQEALSLLSKSDSAPAQEQLVEALAGIKPEDAPIAAPSEEVQKLAESSTEVIDAELLGVYLEEAGEVLGSIRENLALARSQPASIELLRTIRRGYHTLKGSGRMVGLTRLSEAAWAIEKLMNGWLEAERPGNESLFELIADGEELFTKAVAALKAKQPLPDEAPVVAKAAAVESGESVVVIGERRLTPALYQIFLGESRSHVGALQEMQTRLADGGQVLEDDVRAAHTLAGVCGSVGFAPMREVASALEVALERLVSLPISFNARHTLAEAVLGLEGMVQSVAQKSEPAARADIVASLASIEAPPQPAALASVLPIEEVPVQPEAPAPLPVLSIEPADALDFSVSDAIGTPALEPIGERPASEQPALFVPTAAAGTPAISSLFDGDAEVKPAAPVESVAPASVPQALFTPSVPVEPTPPSAPEQAERVAPAEHASSAAPEGPVRLTTTRMAAFAAVLPAAVAAARSAKPDEPAEDGENRLHDDIDPQLLELFMEEAQELIPAISASLRDWRDAPTNPAAGRALNRYLHTLKGSARMAGAMRLGELLHDMETRVENALLLSPLPDTLFDGLESQFDRMSAQFDRLHSPQSALPETEPLAAEPVAEAAEPEVAAERPAVEPVAEPISALAVGPVAAPLAPIAEEALAAPVAEARGGAVPAVADMERVPLLRVRADAVDRLVNQAGEVAIARSRIEGELKVFKSALSELTENISRLRGQLREIEIQAETQIQSRMVQATPDDERQFDPLEFDRYTRFQELTRMMAESVSDVAAVHQNISRALDETDAALLAQARMSRDLQQDLLRVRMVPFKNVSERLYRIVRQAAKDAGKRATLDIRGSQTELDRSVLERITAPFEHMLRNAVAHGIEAPSVRRASGKAEVGEVRIEIRQEGNEVTLAVSDDGGGLDLERIRQKAIERGLLERDAPVAEAETADFIFHPGFSTADEVTQLAGRGVGMDVVKSEISTLGGRVEVSTEAGKGTRFLIFLPLTLAVTQAVIVKAGPAKYAIPGLLVEQVRQVRADELAEFYRTRVATWQNRQAPFHYLPRLLGDQQSAPEAKRLAPVIFVRSGSNVVAIHVDEMIGNQEIVVKNTGPLLARVAGVTGATVLGSGEIVLILNPVVITAREAQPSAVVVASASTAKSAAASSEPTVMIVDDSLTVRKITGRLLSREGYQVVTARDGVDAIEQLEEMVPDVMVLDIEMPRMDGFDLTRNIRSNPRLKHLPIVMVTSRTADKHRNYAMEIGVNAFLGKPYRDDELLGTIAGFLGSRAPRALSAPAASTAH
jgi:chemosensory pili system protein ChpA (sensor histidine kinase/response regulator)